MQLNAPSMPRWSDISRQAMNLKTGNIPVILGFEFRKEKVFNKGAAGKKKTLDQRKTAIFTPTAAWIRETFFSEARKQGSLFPTSVKAHFHLSYLHVKRKWIQYMPE